MKIGLDYFKNVLPTLNSGTNGMAMLGSRPSFLSVYDKQDSQSKALSKYHDLKFRIIKTRSFIH